MEATIFSFGTITCLVLSIIVPLLLMQGLGKVLIAKGLGESESKAIVRKTSLGIFIWAALISGVSITGFFTDFTPPPRLFIVIATIFIGSFILTFSKGITELLRFVPPSWLLHIQFFRVPVEIMLWILFLEGIAPEQMTFEGRNWDILVGITGPIFGYFCFKKDGWGRKVAIIWNITGLLILGNILVIAVLSMPTPFRVFMNEPANTMVATFPMILLPAILVTTAILMHFFSLRQLTIHKNMFNNQ